MPNNKVFTFFHFFFLFLNLIFVLFQLIYRPIITPFSSYSFSSTPAPPLCTSGVSFTTPVNPVQSLTHLIIKIWSVDTKFIKFATFFLQIILHSWWHLLLLTLQLQDFLQKGVKLKLKYLRAFPRLYPSRSQKQGKYWLKSKEAAAVATARLPSPPVHHWVSTLQMRILIRLEILISVGWFSVRFSEGACFISLSLCKISLVDKEMAVL